MDEIELAALTDRLSGKPIVLFSLDVTDTEAAVINAELKRRGGTSAICPASAFTDFKYDPDRSVPDNADALHGYIEVPWPIAPSSPSGTP